MMREKAALNSGKAQDYSQTGLGTFRQQIT